MIPETEGGRGIRKGQKGDDDDDVVMDDKLAAKESQQRGRNKKRTKNADSDIDMSSDDVDTSAVKVTGRSLTPAQRHISAQKKHRSLT